MIRHPTTLVLGAGASKEYGYMLGIDLVANIIELLTDMTFKSRMANRNAMSSFEDLCRKLHYRPSIDRVLQGFQTDLLEIGKYAIAYKLLHCEQVSLMETSKPHWYKHLLDHILGGISNPLDLPSQCPLNLVTFNYDLSFEEFFYRGVSNYDERFSKEDALSFMKRIQPHHVHGRLHPLKWEGDQGSASGLDYGHGDRCSLDSHILASARGIQIPQTRDIMDEGIDTRARGLLLNSSRIVFLGFAYDEVNMRRLGFKTRREMEQIAARTNSSFGTSYNRQWQEKEIIGMFYPQDAIKDSYERIEREYAPLKLFPANSILEFFQNYCDLSASSININNTYDDRFRQ